MTVACLLYDMVRKRGISNILMYTKDIFLNKMGCHVTLPHLLSCINCVRLFARRHIQ